MGTFLLGGLGLWLALNGVVAARLIRRTNQSDENLADKIVLTLHQQT